MQISSRFSLIRYDILAVVLFSIVAANSFVSNFLCFRCYRPHGRSFQSEPDSPTQIFVGNIPLNVSLDALTSRLNETVPIASVILQYDSLTRNHKGYGNIWFSSLAQANEALGVLKDFKLNGVSLKFESFESNVSERKSQLLSDDRSLYLGNMAFETRKEDIYVLCTSLDVDVVGIRYPKGSSPLYCYLVVLFNCRCIPRICSFRFP